MKTEDMTYMLVQDQRGTAMKRLISLLAAATAVVVLALPGLAQIINTSTSYTWGLDCSGAAAYPSLGVGTGVTGYWLNNGVQISTIPFTNQWDGTASCATPPFSGNGPVPTSINGIQVNGIQVTLFLSENPTGCQASASVTKSFDPLSPKFSIKASVSAPAQVAYFKTFKESCPKASFSFSISTS